MNVLSSEMQSKLESSQIIWLASVRAQGKPHLVPVWFVFQSQKIYICIDPSSVKASNIKQARWVAVALEDGSKPVICEGQADAVIASWPAEVIDGFKTKYDWDITNEKQYTQLVEITPHKWLAW